MYRQDAIRYDLVTSPSPYFSKVFTSAFALAKWNKEKTIIETGYPRNDVLIKHSPEDAKHLRKKYGIAENKKIVLYAPTWREDKHTLTRGYEFDLKFDLDRLRKQFGETHFFIFKMHQFVSDYLNIPHDEVFRDLSSVSDINELFIISDVLITDYSSVFFDFALLQRPILYYMYDLEKYRDETRGFYLDVHSLPGPVLTTEEELLQSLANINHLDDKTAEQLNRFNQIYNPLEDGNSSKRVIDSFLQLS